VEDIEEVRLELLDLELVLLVLLVLVLVLMLLMLVLELLWALKVENVVGKVLEIVLGLVLRDILVGALKITSVIPEMTVVEPDKENAELTGTVAGPVNMTSVIPLITVTKPGIEGIEVI